MEFNERKLSLSVEPTLRVCPVDTIHPYTPLFAPAYLCLRENQKFVALKAPLDFFTPQELERIKPFQNLYFTRFIDRILPFQQAAQKARILCTLDVPVYPPDGPPISPAPYELSRALLDLLVPLWGEKRQIEPFFIGAFCAELCGAWPAELLVSARNADVTTYESALLKSGIAVFFALLLGHTKLSYLRALQHSFFAPPAFYSPELNELTILSEIWVDDLTGPPGSRILLDAFENHPTQTGQRLAARLKTALHRGLLKESGDSASLFGEGGLLNVEI